MSGLTLHRGNSDTKKCTLLTRFFWHSRIESYSAQKIKTAAVIAEPNFVADLRHLSIFLPSDTFFSVQFLLQCDRQIELILYQAGTFSTFTFLNKHIQFSFYLALAEAMKYLQLQ